MTYLKPNHQSNVRNNEATATMIRNYQPRRLSKALADQYLQGVKSLVTDAQPSSFDRARRMLHGACRLIEDQSPSSGETLEELFSELSIAFWEGNTTLSVDDRANVKRELRRLNKAMRGFSLEEPVPSPRGEVRPPLLDADFTALLTACENDLQALGAIVALAGAGGRSSRLLGCSFTLNPPRCSYRGTVRRIVGISDDVLERLNGVTLNGSAFDRVSRLIRSLDLHVNAHHLHDRFASQVLTLELPFTELINRYPLSVECAVERSAHVAFVSAFQYKEYLRG
jgi:hypothetical protein